MHYNIVRYIQGMILKIEAVLLLLPAFVGCIYREKAAWSFFIVAAITAALGFLLTIRKPKKFVFYAREGIVSVSFAWILISIFGAIPFVINGDIPNYTDALFETISGFTTTGASILADVEVLSHASLFWRSFTHWVGGMGVIVFMLAIVPMTGGYNAQLMRAESPGPSFGKLVPKLRESAKILYLIYFAMTVITIAALLIAGMPLFDSLCMAFGAAGTGGFGIHNDSIGGYTILQQAILTIAMLAFGVNFNAYYFLLGKDKKQAFKMEEVRWYFLIVAAAIAIITFNIRSTFESLYLAFHHAAFQVATIITTTGYSTVDFDRWPELSRGILVLLMFIGACAGSTGGGIKVSRIVILFKTVKQQVVEYLHPNAVTCVKFDGRTSEKETVHGVSVYLATYLFLFVISVFILTLDPRWDLVTDFTAAAATFNNIGPGLAGVGPTCNYGGLTVLSKYTLMYDMLAGRLELYPMLMLFLPRVWKRN
ncbi:trk system potassium uptake protein TrkH [Lachnospiraceae bacterium NK3A20]|nr:trk system potassium uptake protein TrkH [Lachnospiraceae bacterium NK3A20]